MAVETMALDHHKLSSLMIKEELLINKESSLMEMPLSFTRNTKN
jgi:hypothetical protein